MALFTLIEDWRYKIDTTGHSSGFEDPEFDDSAWSDGVAPFGKNDPPNNPRDFVTAWTGQDNDLCARTSLYVPAGAASLILRLDVDFDGEVFVNGTSVGTGDHTAVVDLTVDPILWDTGINIVAVRAHADAAQHYFALHSSPAHTPPVPGMWADWGKDGFSESGGADDSAPLARMLPEGDAETAIDEITDDVMHVLIRRGGFADHLGGTSPGTMTVTVKNHTGKYNPDNASSTLHPYLVPDVPIWFGVNTDGTVEDVGDTVYGRFGGYIREIVPLPVPGSSGTAQLICDDAMARYRRARPRVTFAEGRSIAEYRAAVLVAIGEDRYDLDTDADVLAFSGTTGTRTRQVITGSAGTFGTVQEAIAQLTARQRQPTSDALRLLEELNSLTGSRHFVAPGDSKEALYQYRTVNRHHKLTAAADANLDGDDTTGTAGYRVTSETIVNLQEVEVRPTTVASSPSTVWRLGDVPFALVNSAPRVIVAEFGDQVFGATVDVASNGSTVTTSFTSFGDGALIRLDSAGTSQVTSITVTGTMVRRDPAMTVEKSSTSSILAYGEHRGQSIGSDLMQSTGLAEGIADFILWKFAQPLKRPSVSVVNTLATTLPLELYDVVTLSIDRLNVSGRRFEIIGMSEEWHRVAAGLVHAAFSFELQETPNQSALSLFTIGVSTFGGSDGLAP